MLAIAMIANTGPQPSTAAPPDVIQANMDYDASGYVAPAGMVPPEMYQGSVMPVGFYGSSGSCDNGGCCDGGCGGGCDGGCGSGCGQCGLGCGGCCCSILGSGGLLGKIRGEGDCSSSHLSGLRHLCIFCRGQGCSACQSLGNTQWLGGIGCLLPYSKQGICAQRWYDLSVEGMFLSHSNGGLNMPITTLGQAPGAPGDPVPDNIVVLRLGDADSGGDLESGVRLSGSMIWGPGGNLEMTYVGGNQWTSAATVSDPGQGLFSFVSDFGRQPNLGFDDTDRSLQQSVSNKSQFHSGELNYRRRTMWPCCRFQGSWLIGLRYVRFEDGLTYATLGETDGSRFFSSNDRLRNDIFGPQAGFDFWWNVCPGVNFGIGSKLAWVSNSVNRTTVLQANSLTSVVALTDNDRKSSVLGEFEAKLVYRFSHSWALRSSYYVVAVDDVAFGVADANTINDFISLAPPSTTPAVNYHSLTVQGFSAGAEFTW